MMQLGSIVMTREQKASRGIRPSGFTFPAPQKFKTQALAGCTSEARGGDRAFPGNSAGRSHGAWSVCLQAHGLECPVLGPELSPLPWALSHIMSLRPLPLPPVTLQEAYGSSTPARVTNSQALPGNGPGRVFLRSRRCGAEHSRFGKHRCPGPDLHGGHRLLSMPGSTQHLPWHPHTPSLQCPHGSTVLASVQALIAASFLSCLPQTKPPAPGTRRLPGDTE